MTKILIVEDEAALQTLLKYNLEKQGYETVSVMDGKDVITTALAEKPSLILLDWMLPNVSGIDLCREIRKNFDLRKIPIIMLTARSDEADKVKGRLKAKNIRRWCAYARDLHARTLRRLSR